VNHGASLKKEKNNTLIANHPQKASNPPQWIPKGGVVWGNQGRRKVHPNGNCPANWGDGRTTKTCQQVPVYT